MPGFLTSFSGAATNPARAWLDLAWSPRTLPIGKVQLLMQSLAWGKVCVAELKEVLETEWVGVGSRLPAKGL